MLLVSIPLADANGYMLTRHSPLMLRSLATLPIAKRVTFPVESPRKHARRGSGLLEHKVAHGVADRAVCQWKEFLRRAGDRVRSTEKGELMGYDIVSMVPAFCDALTGAGTVQGGLPFPKRLKQTAMDYSLAGLKMLDRYLDYLYEHADEIEDQQYTNVVLAAGCYVGEVMRRLTGDKFEWVNYDDYIETRPDMAELLPEGVATAAVLASPDGVEMRLPLNKVARYIGEGPENSVHYFVAAELAEEE